MQFAPSHKKLQLRTSGINQKIMASLSNFSLIDIAGGLVYHHMPLKDSLERWILNWCNFDKITPLFLFSFFFFHFILSFFCVWCLGVWGEGESLSSSYENSFMWNAQMAEANKITNK